MTMRQAKNFIQQHYAYLLMGLTALMVVQLFILNFFDGGIIADGSKQFYQGHNPYNTVGFFNPPHTAIFAFPSIGGAKINAFCNAALLFLALGGKKLNFLLVLFSPFFVISIGEGNIFYVTAIGLLLLLTRQKGILRGVAWALLTCRPQDAGLVAVVDGLAALRERDWKAFGTSALLITPPFVVYGLDWIDTLRDIGGLPQEYTLSVRDNWGILVALVYFALLVLLRMDFSGRRLRPRTLSITERFWLLMMTGWIFIMPYVTLYMIIYALLPLRLFDLRRREHLLRAVLLYAALAVIFGAFFVDPRGFEDDAWQTGFLLIPLAIAFITPKDLPAAEYPVIGDTHDPTQLHPAAGLSRIPRRRNAAPRP